MKKRLTLFMGLPVVAIALAACSSGTSSTSASSTTSARSQSSVPASNHVTSTTTVPTTTPPRVVNCQPGQLKIANVGSSAGAGQVELTIQMTNVSSSVCSMYGYPGMELLDANGNALPTNVIRAGVTFVTNTAANKAPTRVTVAPNAVAEFALRYEDVPVGNETSCPTSTSSRITPPNDYTYSVVPLKIMACGGGTIHVSPVFIPS